MGGELVQYSRAVARYDAAHAPPAEAAATNDVEQAAVLAERADAEARGAPMDEDRDPEATQSEAEAPSEGEAELEVCSETSCSRVGHVVLLWRTLMVVIAGGALMQ